MAELPDNEFDWLNDPALDDEARWVAFKAWEAQKRREFAQSELARVEHKAWVESTPDWKIGSVRPPAARRRKIVRVT